MDKLIVFHRSREELRAKNSCYRVILQNLGDGMRKVEVRSFKLHFPEIKYISPETYELQPPDFISDTPGESELIKMGIQVGMEMIQELNRFLLSPEGQFGPGLTQEELELKKEQEESYRFKAEELMVIRRSEETIYAVNSFYAVILRNQKGHRSVIVRQRYPNLPSILYYSYGKAHIAPQTISPSSVFIPETMQFYIDYAMAMVDEIDRFLDSPEAQF